MDGITYIKGILTVIFASISSFLGVLFIPMSLLLACNVIDYITGVMASAYRSDVIDSDKGIKGIAKKICMWLLVVVGAILDQLILYAGDVVGYALPFTFLFACVVAIWIVCNELISILENITDMGVAVPSFLLPVVEKIKKQAEDTASTESEDD